MRVADYGGFFCDMEKITGRGGALATNTKEDIAFPRGGIQTIVEGEDAPSPSYASHKVKSVLCIKNI